MFGLRFHFVGHAAEKRIDGGNIEDLDRAPAEEKEQSEGEGTDDCVCSSQHHKLNNGTIIEWSQTT